MKTFTLFKGIIFLSLLCTIVSNSGKAQDLPGASSNIQTAPAGTLVIAMDNLNQACSAPTAGNYLFNLKAYGLAVFLLDVNYPLKWCIKAGKPKDAIDFSANAERISPSFQPSVSRNFLAGPLLIYPNDTTGVDYAIRVFNSRLPDSCKVKVYRLTNPASVDVRYNLTRPPKAALLNDSCDIHRNFMEMASVPDFNYDCLPNAYTLRVNCYTIATDPHTMESDLSPFDADSIYNFVMAGGNFLAECEGVQTFEKLKKYHSVTGLMSNLTGGSYANFNSNVYYDNADMAYGQYHGTYRPWVRGAVKVWRYASANTNNFYSVTSCKRSSTDNLYYAATVSKMTSDTGSLVFYLGNHEYYTHDCHTCTAGSTVNEQEINGVRMYLNAVLIPSKFMKCVNVFDIPLAVEMADFTVTKRVDGAAFLQWSSLSEKDHAMYFIEHSTNGKDYTVVGQLAGKGETDRGYNYDFLHKDVKKGLNYYRLRMFSTTGKQTYSETRTLVLSHKKQPLHIFPNPTMGRASLLIDARDGERIHVVLFDLSGKEVKKDILTMRGQKAELDLNDLGRGIYSVTVIRSTGEQLRGKVLVTY